MSDFKLGLAQAISNEVTVTECLFDCADSIFSFIFLVVSIGVIIFTSHKPSIARFKALD